MSMAEITDNDEMADTITLVDVMKSLRRIEPTINEMKDDLSQLRTDMDKMKTEQNTKLLGLSHDIVNIQKELSITKLENQVLKENNKSMNDRLNKLECYSRQKNLIFLNVAEDQAPLANTVSRIFKTMGIQDPQNMVIEATHRMGIVSKSRPRPIIIQFLHKSDRQKVWEARRKLKGTNISLNEDFPEAYNISRSQLLPVVKAAKAAGMNATLVQNKVKVDGHLYGTDELEHLPDKCNPATGCVKETDQTVCYFGRYSPLSNFFPCTFTTLGTTYNCTEQYIQQKKAECMGADRQAQRIILSREPTAQKRIGDSVPGNPQIWYDKAREEILPAVRDKFMQNKKLQEYLLSTGDKTIAEATTDKVWGIGLKLESNVLMDQNQWLCKNVMGKVLMAVRAEIIQK
jgi:ribA/ribD-fused uncharacterized protein